MHHSITQALYALFPQEDKNDFFHSYVYLKHLDHFIYHALQASGWPAKKPDNKIDPDVDELLEAAIQGIAETAGSVDTSTYHGKVVKLKDAIQLVTQKKNIKLEPPETVIPYKQARSIILQNPEVLSVGECACRAVAENSCLSKEEMNVCLFVGDPQSSFLNAFNPKFKPISQEDAVKLLEDCHKRGFVHGAFFKKDLGRRFVAICNCCKCCCQGMKAYNMFEGAIPIFAPSGYVAVINSDECTECGECVDACGFYAIKNDDGPAVVNLDKCMGCGVCESKCPSNAISMRLEPSKGEPLDLAKLLAEAK